MSDERLQRALTVALQGLGQLAKSEENKSNRPSRRKLVKHAEQTLVRVTRILEGHPTFIGEDGHVLLHTLPKELPATNRMSTMRERLRESDE